MPTPEPVGGVRDGVVRQAKPRRGRVLAAISLGGGLGSVARHLVGEAIVWSPGQFPLATFLINVLGCLALGGLNVYLLKARPPRRYAQPFLAVGFLGGFTTFSAYTAEIRELLARGDAALAGAYALGSIAVGLAAVWVGAAGARMMVRRAA